MRWAVPAVALVSMLQACATAQPAAKMTFAEAFPEERQTPVRVVELPGDSFGDKLAHFSRVSERARASLLRGAPMPPAQVDNWRALQRLLHARWAKASADELAQVRRVLVVELRADARAYGDFPFELAQSAFRWREQLSTRLTHLRAQQREARREELAHPPRWEWPLEPAVVTSGFGLRRHPVLKVVQRHRGVDFAASRGQVVSSSADGVVRFAGWHGAHGRHVEVEHPGGWVSRYSHLSQLLVEPGTRVEQGDPLGLAGSTGLSTGVHLHFELHQAGRPVDPMAQLQGVGPASEPLATR